MCAIGGPGAQERRHRRPEATKELKRPSGVVRAGQTAADMPPTDQCARSLLSGPRATSSPIDIKLITLIRRQVDHTVRIRRTKPTHAKNEHLGGIRTPVRAPDPSRPIGPPDGGWGTILARRASTRHGTGGQTLATSPCPASSESREACRAALMRSTAPEGGEESHFSIARRIGRSLYQCFKFCNRNVRAPSGRGATQPYPRLRMSDPVHGQTRASQCPDRPTLRSLRFPRIASAWTAVPCSAGRPEAAVDGTPPLPTPGQTDRNAHPAPSSIPYPQRRAPAVIIDPGIGAVWETSALIRTHTSRRLPPNPRADARWRRKGPHPESSNASLPTHLHFDLFGGLFPSAPSGALDSAIRCGAPRSGAAMDWVPAASAKDRSYDPRQLTLLRLLPLSPARPRRPKAARLKLPSRGPPPEQQTLPDFDRIDAVYGAICYPCCNHQRLPWIMAYIWNPWKDQKAKESVLADPPRELGNFSIFGMSPLVEGVIPQSTKYPPHATMSSENSEPPFPYDRNPHSHFPHELMAVPKEQPNREAVR